jgi:hypothetical protein
MRKKNNAQGRLSKVVLGVAGAMALGLAVPGLAQEENGPEAQQADEGNGEARDMEQAEPAEPGEAKLGEEQLGPQRRTSYSIGTVQGTVDQLDFQEGLLTLRSADGDVEIRARPMDITNLNPGDVVAIDFSNYNGVLWLQPEDADLDAESFAQFGTLTGNVSEVDKTEGTITVRGQTMRAHPDQLLPIVPGQFVSLGYANIAGTNWVAQVDKASAQ